MTPGVHPLVAGNWKMNGLKASLSELEAMKKGVEAGGAGSAVVAICPPATLIAMAAWALREGKIGLGGQNCNAAESGAHTGEISAAMLKDVGAGYVIVGHSERRAGFAETDAMVRAKAEAAHKAGLVAIICVGETRAEREGGHAETVVLTQVRGSVPAGSTSANTVIAYEPVWAIGTGLVPTAADVAAMHAAIRGLLGAIMGAEGGKTRILYGGSVKASNARELLGLPNVDGALVGGASLKAADFLGITAAYV